MGSQGVARGSLIMLATAVAAGVAFYVLREHWAHALGFTPYLLFLACPLMHLFMHGGHKHESNQIEQKRQKNTSAGCH